MIIRSLELSQFRNYERETFVFDAGTNVLYGDNAQGKTNVLEAIYVGGTTRSHKGSRDAELIRMGEEEAHIRYVISKEETENEREDTIEFHLRRHGKRGIAINRIPISRTEELLGLMHPVFFSPEDLGIIKDGPEARRRFINMELCQLNKAYLYHLTVYNKNLKQRNALLKQIDKNPSLADTLDIWTKGIVDNGIRIIRIRQQFIGELEDIMHEKHKHLTGGKEEIRLVYEPNVSAEQLEERIFLAEDRDRMQGTTTVGPHRDDIQFLIGDTDIRKYGSQGQKRTAALSLKMAEIDLVERMTREKPILLLDDVLSELDRNRQNYLLEQIQGIQTIITCTGLEEFVESGVGINKTFHIKQGRNDLESIAEKFSHVK